MNIKWNDLDFKGKTSGEINITCPSCSHTRKKKSQKCLRVNISKGLGFCHHCNEVVMRENKTLTDMKPYKLPVQVWRNYTDIPDGLVKYFEKRKISQATLKELKVSEESYYQPAANKNMSNIVFNYFEGNVLVNKKFRSGKKHFTQLPGAKPIFYNINSVINEDVVYIVEGEMDVLSMHEAGYKNTISIPNGANDNDDYWINCEPYLKKVKKFFIATDNDEKGEMVSEKIVQRLGRYRCERILFKNKDANGDLVEGVDVLHKSIRNAKPYPSVGTYTIDDLIDEVYDIYDNGLPQTYFPKHHSFGKLKDIFSVMRGHLVIGTGIPSHGKSNFTEWYVMNLVHDYNMKASFFSPEHHPMSLHQISFIEKFHGKNFYQDNEGLPRITKKEIEIYRHWANEKIYFTTQDTGEPPTWNWLIEKFKEQMFIYGVDIFVVDAFNKVDFDSAKDNDLSNIRKVLTKLTTFCQLNNVIIFLVAHPTKMKKNESGTYICPTLYDVSGSADFRNQTHDGFCIYRYFEDAQDGANEYSKNQVEFIVEKLKMKFQGDMTASEVFEYHIPSGRYYASSFLNPPQQSFYQEIEEEKENLF